MKQLFILLSQALSYNFIFCKSIMFKKDKEKDLTDFQLTQKPNKTINHFKALYQLSKLRKSQTITKQQRPKQQYMTHRNSNQPKSSQRLKIPELAEDSLDQLQILNEEEENIHITKPEKIRNKNSDKKIQEQLQENRKKASHSRSNSCPFINPTNVQSKGQTKVQKPSPFYLNKFVNENESKRTLKKISTLHKKNKKIQHKYSASQCSQVSQESHTMIVHSLPVEQLSSMLYSSHRVKDQSFKKSSSSILKQTQHIYSIHSDLYFQTRLQQQIKMYDLNQQLKKLNKETENVKIKQQVLEKLANKIGNYEDDQTDLDASLLIHHI